MAKNEWESIVHDLYSPFLFAIYEWVVMGIYKTISST
jgi:hypothetical protein